MTDRPTAAAVPSGSVPAGAPPVDLMAGLMPPDASAGRAPDLLPIREMTRQFGVTARALRFYEERGLIEPRREGADRLYSRRDRARLRLVLMGKAVGFSLDDIKAMLDLYDIGDGGVTQLKVARARFTEQIDRLERQRRDIDTAIGEIARAMGVVDRMLIDRTTA